jgi:hypothetical protein
MSQGSAAVGLESTGQERRDSAPCGQAHMSRSRAEGVFNVSNAIWPRVNGCKT